MRGIFHSHRSFAHISYPFIVLQDIFNRLSDPRHVVLMRAELALLPSSRSDLLNFVEPKSKQVLSCILSIISATGMSKL